MNTHEHYVKNWTSLLPQLFQGFRAITFPGERDIAKAFTQMLARHIPQGDLMLAEVGPGNGRTTRVVLEGLLKFSSIKSYTGIEISHEMIRQLSKRDWLSCLDLEPKLLQADANSVNLGHNFDCVFSLHSWYGVGLDRINYFVPKLNSGGVLAIVMGVKGCVTNDLTDQFTDERIVSAEDLEGWLCAQELSFEIEELVSNKVTKSSYLIHSRDSDHALRYLTRRPSGELDDVRSFLAEKPEEYFFTRVKSFFIWR